MSGKIPSSSERLNIIHRGTEIADLILTKKEPGIPSGLALVMFDRVFNLVTISETEK
jgi:hypothetical protein